MRPTAHVGHAIPGRTRVKIPSKRGDAVYFAQVEDALNERPGILRLRSNSDTASVLIDHSTDLGVEDIGAYGESAELFALENTEDPALPAAQLVADNLKRLDTRVKEYSEGNTDVRSILVLALLLLGVVQVLRGQILGPAFAYFWYAFQLTGGPPDFDASD